MSNFDNEPQNTKLNKVISDLLTDMNGLNGEELSKATDILVKLTKIKNDTLKTETDALSETEKIAIDQQKLRIEDAKLGLETERLGFEKEKIAIDREKLRLDDDQLGIDKEKLEFEKEKTSSWRPSPDAIVGAAAGFLGIIAILHYEKLGVVTSKALAFVGRGVK